MLDSVPLERPIYYKETSSKKYSPFPYFLAKLIIEACSVVVGALFFSVTAYWLMGFTHTFQQFILFGKNQVI
jgi:ABC-type multidrug transport system permease subunit